jgi:hypothetical protein
MIYEITTILSKLHENEALNHQQREMKVTRGWNNQPEEIGEKGTS